ncbi:GNAT family N-acetyltransferase [Niabella yanshanensis]|uniref:GNAT family N-acetyltransferase n=1 Tax=Niabella yanshanensis TaxID=577386 RepID=A0ABZ0W9R6_9BACT|nr:GNAT family N-acetyltransferase [Niabella yanshanensis]WQD38895.1 GNAT family N-acetyltransferase [Niabella yanshanensis]
MPIVERHLIEQWLRAWCLSRRLPLPVPYGSGFKVEVGYPDQQARYVFPSFSEEVIALAETIHEPHIFLKICNAPPNLSALLPGRWVVQPEAAMMSCFHPMRGVMPALPAGYIPETEQYPATQVLRIICRESLELAAVGRLVITGDLAVYDRICTTAAHQRKGLATILMRELENLALTQGVSKNLLVATAEGRLLYERMGWSLYCPYSSVVIPG